MTTEADQMEPTLTVRAVPRDESVPEADPSAPRASQGLNSRQKVAVVLAQLGSHKAAPILKEMTDEEAIGLTTEMVGLPPLSADTVIGILAEFMDRVSQSDLVSQGSIELARELLQDRLGQARALEIMEQVEGQRITSPLSGLLRVDPRQALTVLGEQQPQVVAVLLAYLPPEDAAQMLSELDPAFRARVATRIAKLTRVDPAAIRQATALIEGKLRNSQAGGPTALAGGTTAIAEILNHADRSIEQQILTELEGKDQELADQIRAKLFTFDDVVALDDRALQQILRQVDAPTLALAMKGPQLSPEAAAKIRANLSERVTTMLDEEIEVLGAVRSSQINAAQATIVRTARQLDADGVIVIARDDEVVL
jgi:flagellar motor switch protein FliG